jgi:hypothetical protein
MNMHINKIHQMEHRSIVIRIHKIICSRKIYGTNTIFQYIYSYVKDKKKKGCKEEREERMEVLVSLIRSICITGATHAYSTFQIVGKVANLANPLCR